MTGKRKRSRTRAVDKTNKKLKLPGSNQSNEEVVKHSLLSQYYNEVLTLREYLVSKLPVSSKVRRKKVNSIGRSRQYTGNGDEAAEARIGRYLDETLVGQIHTSVHSPSHERLKEWTSFSQRADVSEMTVGGSGEFCQSEVSVPMFKSS
jgi:telomerase reverse transcriptase